MVVKYILVTRRILDGMYQHELFFNGSEINIGDLPERFRNVIDCVGRNDARALEYMEKEGIGRNKLESFLALGAIR